MYCYRHNLIKVLQHSESFYFRNILHTFYSLTRGLGNIQHTKTMEDLENLGGYTGSSPDFERQPTNTISMDVVNPSKLHIPCGLPQAQNNDTGTSSRSFHLNLTTNFKRSLNTTAVREESEFETEAGNTQDSKMYNEEEIKSLLAGVLQYREKNTSSLIVEAKVCELCEAYLQFSPESKSVFLQTLALHFGVDHTRVAALAKVVIEVQSREEQALVKAEDNLRTSLIPRNYWFFGQIGRIERGVKFLVDLRTDVLELIGRLDAEHTATAHLRVLNTSLRELLGLWFSVGFLELERVTWQSPCEMLQKVSDYEAVHPMRNWTDLKRRVGSFRRCFVFTHHSMPGEPIVVLHTALTNEISTSIKNIVTTRMSASGSALSRRYSCGVEVDCGSSSGQTEDPNFISTAIFYSITSTQRGLHGIELGNYLIKRVVKELQSEFPKMHQFSSLSPIPGFCSWIVNIIRDIERNEGKGLSNLFTVAELEMLASELKVPTDPINLTAVCTELRRALNNNSWFQDESIATRLETPFMRLCARYLYLEKRRGYALDSVANFHLRNGAMIWKLNWKADPTPRGLSNSCGIMVNYRYFLEACEQHSQQYLESQIIDASDQVKHLAKLSKMVSETTDVAVPEGKL